MQEFADALHLLPPRSDDRHDFPGKLGNPRAGLFHHPISEGQNRLHLIGHRRHLPGRESDLVDHRPELPNDGFGLLRQRPDLLLHPSGNAIQSEHGHGLHHERDRCQRHGRHHHHAKRVFSHSRGPFPQFLGYVADPSHELTASR